jgi:hypothetical protein
MSSDVKAVYWTSTDGTGSNGIGTVIGGRNRIKGIHVHTSGGANSVLEIKDGSTGSQVIKADFQKTDNDSIYVPGDGLLCVNEAYVSVFTNVTSITVFYA